jgi:subtilase family serine protease
MQRSYGYRLGLAVIVVLVIAVSAFSISFFARATPGSRVMINGQAVPLIKSAQFVGTASAEQYLDLSIGLKIRNPQKLEELLRNMYNPHSPLYRRFLTPQQFTAEFGPTREQLKQVTDYLRRQGIAVTGVAPNGLLVNARATVASVEAAFQVKINTYRLGAHFFYANASAPSVPSPLETLILSIGGMDNSVQWRPLSWRGGLPMQPAHVHELLPLAGYGPPDLASAYGVAPLQKAGFLGSEQTIAYFELDGYKRADIEQFFKNNGLGTPNLNDVLVDGFNGAAGPGAIEVELDIEIAAAMAPKAAHIVYMGPNTTQGVNDTYSKIVNDGKAQLVSISWGLCEAESGTAELQTLNGIFKQAASQGMTLFAASGDSGAYDCNDSKLAVDSPAGDPYITGVGGTRLQATGGTYGSETVWSNPSDTQRSPKGAGGGGGLSSFFPLPEWQVGPGVKNQYSNGNRQVPDVSANADPQTGYAVYCTVAASGCPSTGNIVVGGTSAAAPLWAGSTALINEYLQKQGKARIGFISPMLYNLANSQQPYPPFHDVTTGNNLYYSASANYDLASGLGSPDIYNIARDIAGGSGPGPGPSPTPNPTETPTPVPTVTNTPVITPTQTLPPSTGSLVKNGDFEQGSVGWRESSRAGYELVETRNPHTGQYGAYLCGYSSCRDVIAQIFTLPERATKITVHYWWYSKTTRTTQTCSDELSALLVNENGDTLVRMQRVCNGDAVQQWKSVSFDVTQALSSYGGQNVMLVFAGQTTAARATTAFFVDDVAVVAQ